MYRWTIHFRMIKTFRHRGLQRFFEKGSKAGIQPAHAAKLARQLRQLNDADGPDDMDMPGWNLHPLKGRDLKGHWSVRVSGVASNVSVRRSRRRFG